MSKSSALEDNKLSECIKHVHDKYLSKPFSAAAASVMDPPLQCKIGDEIIHRPYSNVAHAARLALYVPMVIENLKDHNKSKQKGPDPYEDLNVAQIQFTCLYLGAHKANEGHIFHKENKDGLKNSIKAFKEDAQKQPFFKNDKGEVDQEAINRCANAMEHPRDPSQIKAKDKDSITKLAIHISGQMDLSRKEKIGYIKSVALSDCKNHLGEDNAVELFHYAARCIDKTFGVADPRVLDKKEWQEPCTLPIPVPEQDLNKEALLKYTNDPEQIIKDLKNIQISYQISYEGAKILNASKEVQDEGVKILNALKEVQKDFHKRHKTPKKKCVIVKNAAINAAISSAQLALREGKIITPDELKKIKKTATDLKKTLEKHRLFSFRGQAKSLQSLRKHTPRSWS
jgi:hypothetical protein